MSPSLHPMLNIAIKAARAAGAIINRGSQDLDLLTVGRKGPNDFVSEVDRAAEAAIIEVLLGAYPDHGILGEETGRTHGRQDSDHLWIIDPLDGTTNFLHGFPVYCVSIALAFRGKVEQAVVYDPTRNDLFYASKGRGAFLNDKRLRVSKRTRLSDALVGTGFPFRRGDNFQRYLKMFEQVMQSCAGLRRPGAAALDLCYVAAGWYDGFFESGLNPWDIAAGSLIITEAGGLIGNFTGEADFLYQREVVAGNPKVYGQLVTLLAPYSRAIRPDEAADGGPEAAGLAGPPAASTPSGPVAALASALANEGTDRAPSGAGAPLAADAAAPDAPTPPARERKPVRIRRAEVAPDDLAAQAQAPAPAPAPASTSTAAPADPQAAAVAADAPAPVPADAPRPRAQRVPQAEAPRRPPAPRGASDRGGPDRGEPRRGPGPGTGRPPARGDGPGRPGRGDARPDHRGGPRGDARNAGPRGPGDRGPRGQGDSRGPVGGRGAPRGKPGGGRSGGGGGGHGGGGRG